MGRILQQHPLHCGSSLQIPKAAKRRAKAQQVLVSKYSAGKSPDLVFDQRARVPAVGFRFTAVPAAF